MKLIILALLVMALGAWVVRGWFIDRRRM